MSAPRQLPRALVRRGVPWRTRWSLLATAVKRRVRPAPVYFVRLGTGSVPISHADYGVDWETMRTIVVDRAYALDFTDAVVVDVGAHKGCFGAFALEQGARAVISFEPEQANFDFLELCAGPYRRGGRDWRLHRAAVAGTAGKADLHVMGASWGHTLTPPDESGAYEVGVQQIQVVAMRDVLAEAARAAGEGPLVVKVNAEGAECAIVLETPIASWESVTEFLAEVHSWSPCTADELTAFLLHAGLLEVHRGGASWVLRLSRRLGS